MKLCVRHNTLYVCIIVALMVVGVARGAEPQVDTLLHIDGVQVTAIKTGHALQREAAASSLLGSRTLDMGGVTAIKQVMQMVPNVYMPDYGSRITSSIYVRGLGTRIDQPVVGMNIDNMPVADKNMYDLSLPDIERIEVLRGPQSTLFGRNTMGGVINIYTLSPMTYQGVRLRGEYGSRNAYRLSASAYNRLGERFGVSVAAQFAHCDGFYRNGYDGSLCDRENDGTLRAKFQYREGRLSIDNTLSMAFTRQGGYPYSYIGTSREEDGYAALRGTINYNEPCSYERLGVNDVMTVAYRWDKVSLTSITSYQFLDDNMHLDNDFLPDDYFTLTQAKRQHDVTEEVVVRSTVPGWYEWIAGGFAFYRRQGMQAPVTFGATGIKSLILENVNAHSGFPGEYRWGDLDGNGGDCFTLGSDFTTDNVGAALYHQSNFNVGRWRFSLGLRLDYESVNMRYHNAVHTCYSAIYDKSQYPDMQDLTVPLDIEDSGRLSKHYVELLPRLAISVDLDAARRNMLYLVASKGYKAGGYNTQMFSEILQRRLQSKMGMVRDYDVEKLTSYDPEYSWNFELGGHFAALDGRLRMDAALFHIECFDQQITIFPSAESTGRMMTNAGRTRSTGVEVAATAIVARRLTISASYGFTDARFRRFESKGIDHAGNVVPYAPRHIFAVQLSHAVPLDVPHLERIVFNVGCTGAGPIYWSEANDVRQPVYALLNGSVRLEERRWSLDVWVKNATDARYDLFYFESMGNRFVQRGRPVSAGVRVGLNLLSNN